MLTVSLLPAMIPHGPQQSVRQTPTLGLNYESKQHLFCFAETASQNAAQAVLKLTSLCLCLPDAAITSGCC